MCRMLAIGAGTGQKLMATTAATATATATGTATEFLAADYADVCGLNRCTSRARLDPAASRFFVNNTRGQPRTRNPIKKSCDPARLTAPMRCTVPIRFNPRNPRQEIRLQFAVAVRRCSSPLQFAVAVAGTIFVARCFNLRAVPSPDPAAPRAPLESHTQRSRSRAASQASPRT